MYLELAILTLFTFGYGLVSERIARLPMSGPIVFVLAGVVLGPVGLGWFRSEVEGNQLQHLVDLTLALILFTDAATTNFAVLRRDWQLPARMLGIALPGAMLLGALLASAMFGVLSIYEAALLGTMLAATDAALGKAVVVDERVPAPVRMGLNFESGLNDGLCVPFVLLFIALASGVEAEAPLTLFAQEIGIGLAVGLGLAGGGAALLKFSAAHGWVSAIWLQLCVPALAAACFAIAQSVHGSGYIAAFAGGVLFGSMTKDRAHSLVMPAEGIGEAMAMLTWLTFGVAVVDKILGALTWQVLGYALLSLTLVRMVPVAAALAGSGTRGDNILFMGWFGPRGLASIVFAILVVQAKLPHSELIAFVVTCTVGLSLLLHGITATPLANWLARRYGGAPVTR